MECFGEVRRREVRDRFGRVDVRLVQDSVGFVCEYGGKASYSVGGVDFGMVEGIFGVGGEGGGEVGDELVGVGSG